MAHIEYSGINPESIELINSNEFGAVLAAHPELKLVTVEEDDETGAEIFNEATLPLPEGYYDCVAVMDRSVPDAFMWVLNDSQCFTEDPSPAFIDVLKVMDAFSVKTQEERLFLSMDPDFYTDDPEVLAAKFDFATGEYIL
jgi:hypothetical protein